MGEEVEHYVHPHAEYHSILTRLLKSHGYSEIMSWGTDTGGTFRRSFKKTARESFYMNEILLFYTVIITHFCRVSFLLFNGIGWTDDVKII